MNDFISVQNLAKTYRTHQRGSGIRDLVKSIFKREYVTVKAVDGISFSIREGEIAGILGPNGAGKSTTIKMLTGTLHPSGGHIEVMGFHPAKDRMRYVREIGAVFGQKSQLIWDIPPIDSFQMNKAIYGIPDDRFQERLRLLKNLFELDGIVGKPTRVLSLGERMKCEFIMAMLHEPKIVFLDEPTIGLDVIAKQRIRDFIREMNRQGTTFILTTHDLDDVEQLAHKVIIINHGQKVFDDSLPALQKSLGTKKLVELTLAAPFEGLSAEGVRVAEQKSAMEVTLEADIEQIPIAAFMELLAKAYPFTDISIRSLPMEMIITQIYEKRACD